MNSPKIIAKIGILSALSLIFSYIESLFPFITPLPAVKMGLSNIVILYALYKVSIYAACFSMIIRVVLSGLMFQGGFSIIYGLAGGFLSILIMFLLKKTNKLSIVSVSVAGGFMHNSGQLFVAGALLGFKSIAAYSPVLLISGCVAGLVIGIITQKIIDILGGKK